jgi:hypothetical protein
MIHTPAVSEQPRNPKTFATMAAVEAGDAPFSVSYQAGEIDADGNYLGGTELIAMAAYNGKLYAANGYTADNPGTDPSPGPQVLVLDSPDKKWRQLHAFSETGRLYMTRSLRRFNRIGALRSINFTTDLEGHRLSEQERPRASFLMVALAGQNGDNGDVYAWNEMVNQWIPADIGLRSVRSIGFYRDPLTGSERVFAGGGSGNGRHPGGVYSGAYDARSHSIVWDQTPEFNLFSYRVTDFFEYQGRLFFGARPSIFERINGPHPSWKSVYTYDVQQSREIQRWSGDSGFRGFGIIPDPNGDGERLLAGMEGSGILYRLRLPTTASAQATSIEEQNVRKSLITRFGFPYPYLYVVVAYSDMPLIRGEGPNDSANLIGLGVYHPLRGHEHSAWYYVRDYSGRYNLHEIQSLSENPLIATREIIESPFPSEAGKIFYISGYDTNSQPCHNTAWIYRVGVHTLLER